jgi:hypothetical protein
MLQFASRVVSQDDVEDGDVLVHITGVTETFAERAAECIQHIIDASPEFEVKSKAEGGLKIRLKAAEMFAKRIVNKPDRNPHKLLLCFIMVIYLYTQDWVLYKELNSCLRSRDRKRPLPFFPYLRLLLTAFSCIPPSAVTVFRGVKKDLASKFVKDEQAVWWSVTSTTSSLGTLQEEMFLGKSGNRTMFCIASKTFRDIRHYSAIGVEAECLGCLAPASTSTTCWTRATCRLCRPPEVGQHSPREIKVSVFADNVADFDIRRRPTEAND